MPYLHDARLGQGLLDFPSKIQIQTVNRCNYLCPMCPYPEVTAQEDKTQIDSELFERLIDEVRQAGRQVKLCLMLQNEPLLDRRFVDFLDLAHRSEDAVSSISTVSNGSVLSEELLDTLMAYDRFYLTISVNSTDRERYQAVHGRDLWPRVHRLLSGWQGRRERIRLSFVLSSDALDEGREFQRFWGDLGYATRLVPIFARVDTMTVDSPVHEIDEDYGHCHYPVDTLTVLADGGVVMCCNDWLHTQRLGDLRNQSIAEVWRSEDRRRLQRAALEGTLRDEAMCARCDYPIRSSQRLRLEALIADDAPTDPAAGLPTTPHSASLRAAEGHEIPLLVWNLDEAAGTVSAFAASDRLDWPESGLFEMRIGHCGTFNFGSLESVWCPVEIDPLTDSLGVEGSQAVRLRLDLDSEESRFFTWYCADWRLSSPPPPEGAETPTTGRELGV